MLQSAVAFSTDGSLKGWRGIIEFTADDLSQQFPNSQANFLMVAKHTEVTPCIKAVNSIHTNFQPKRIDVLVELTNSHTFPQCDAQLNNSSLRGLSLT